MSDDLIQALENRFLELAEHLLGEPQRRTSRMWRYGSKGSLSIDLQKGVWKDFESDEGGGPLQLIQREMGLPQARTGEISVFHPPMSPLKK